MKKLKIGVLLIVILSSLNGCWWLRESRNVIREEVGPRALVYKYEWFKDAAASIDRSIANISIYKNSLENIEKMYEGQSRSAWHRSDIDSHNQKISELTGVRAACNALIADYNAQHSKLNWRFTDVGELPEGAEGPLPRTYEAC